jgi:HEAT repeat protein
MKRQVRGPAKLPASKRVRRQALSAKAAIKWKRAILPPAKKTCEPPAWNRIGVSRLPQEALILAALPLRRLLLKPVPQTQVVADLRNRTPRLWLLLPART